jgi:hypothetical protein
MRETMKNTIMIISIIVLIVSGNTTLFAHGKDLHGKPSSEVRHEVRAELKSKTIDETWEFVDITIKDLAKEIRSINYKQSKQELVRLKKSLDILKQKYEDHFQLMESNEEESNYDNNNEHHH